VRGSWTSGPPQARESGSTRTWWWLMEHSTGRSTGGAGRARWALSIGGQDVSGYVCFQVCEPSARRHCLCLVHRELARELVFFCVGRPNPRTRERGDRFRASPASSARSKALRAWGGTGHQDQGSARLAYMSPEQITTAASGRFAAPIFGPLGLWCSTASSPIRCPSTAGKSPGWKVVEA